WSPVLHTTEPSNTKGSRRRASRFVHPNCEHRAAGATEYWVSLVGGLALYYVRIAARTVRRQAGVPNLIQKSSIADVEGLCRLIAVPMVVVQDLQDDLAFELACRLPGELFERNRAVQTDVGREEVGLARLQVAAYGVLGAEDYVTLNYIFKLTDVSRPLILMQDFHQLG